MKLCLFCLLKHEAPRRLERNQDSIARVVCCQGVIWSLWIPTLRGFWLLKTQCFTQYISLKEAFLCGGILQVYDLASTKPTNVIRYGIGCLDKLATSGDECARLIRSNLRIIVCHFFILDLFCNLSFHHFVCLWHCHFGRSKNVSYVVNRVYKSPVVENY